MKEEIFQIIRSKKRISFYEFMDLALYHPEAGYYASGRRIGKEGDFYTSSSVNLYPRAVANHFLKVRKNDEIFLELGAGDGAFAVEFLRYCMEKGAKDVEYFILERSPSEALRRRCRQDHIKLISSPEELEKFNGYVFSNELFDSFPARRFVKRDNRWLEYYVEIQEREPAVVLGEPECSEDVLIASRYFPDAPDGSTVEVQPDIEQFIKSLSMAHTSGLFVAVDYFDTPDRLLLRKGGTLRGFSRHSLIDERDIIRKAGDVDITVTVNGDYVANMLEKYGYKNARRIAQWKFLYEGGIEEVFLEAMEKATPREQVKLKGAFNTIMSPHHMGELFSAILAEKS